MSSLEQRLQAPLVDDAYSNVRERAAQALRSHGFPDLRTEAWKYTSLRQLDKREAGNDARVNALPDLPFAASLIDTVIGSALPTGVRLEPLPADQLAGLEFGGKEDAFAWLNLARVAQPWRLCIDSTPAQPLVLAQFTPEAFTGDRHGFLQIELAEGVSATLIDWQRDSGAGLINQIQTIRMAPGSRLSHVVLREGAESALIQRTEVNVDADADYRFAALDLGGRLHRHDLKVHLIAAGARGEIDGVALIDSGQHVDFHTSIDHAVGHTNSRETFRMLADGSGVGVFNGRIHIHRDADDSHSDLNTANLLLSDSARINTKPELEIYAEDVTASHGATIGQLEDDALFYLRSRGVPASEATSLLKRGFASEPLANIRNEPVRDWALSELERALANH